MHPGPHTVDELVATVHHRGASVRLIVEPLIMEVLVVPLFITEAPVYHSSRGRSL